MNAHKILPNRRDVQPQDTWDLASLFDSDAAWDRALAEWEKRIPTFESFSGTLGHSPQRLAECLAYDLLVDREGDRLGTYAHLRASEDQAAAEAQRMVGRFQHLATLAGEKASFIRPEIMAIAPETLAQWLSTAVLAPYRLLLERLIRTRPHVLSKPEERLLAMQGTVSQTASKVFRQLTDADMKFGTVTNGHGEDVELSNATFVTLLHDTNRDVRHTTFEHFYAQYGAHANTLAATLCGAVERGVYYARA